MVHCTNSFPQERSIFFLAFLALAISLATIGAHSQTRLDGDVYREISLKTTKPCVVHTGGQVTALIKNGVELSVTEDWDCDGIADAYDKCVGIPDPTQMDTDGNGIGDVCEAATLVKARPPVKTRSIAKVDKKPKEKSVDKSSRSVVGNRKAKAVDKRSRSVAEKRRSRAGRPERSKSAETKIRDRKHPEARVRDRKPSAKRKSRA